MSFTSAQLKTIQDMIDAAVSAALLQKMTIEPDTKVDEQLYAEIDATDAARDDVPDDKRNWDMIASLMGEDNYRAYGIDIMEIFRCKITGKYGVLYRYGPSYYDSPDYPVEEYDRAELIGVMCEFRQEMDDEHDCCWYMTREEAERCLDDH